MKKRSRSWPAAGAPAHPSTTRHHNEPHNLHPYRRAVERAASAGQRRRGGRASPRRRRRPARLRVVYGRFPEPVCWRPIRPVALPGGCAVRSVRSARATAAYALPRASAATCSTRSCLTGRAAPHGAPHAAAPDSRPRRLAARLGWASAAVMGDRSSSPLLVGQKHE